MCRDVVSSLVDGDEVLVDRLRAGDESAFVELVRRYQPRLLRVAEATVGRGSVAQEVTQDTWLAVFRGIDRFEGRSSFKSWLFTVLVNGKPVLRDGKMTGTLPGRVLRRP